MTEAREMAINEIRRMPESSIKYIMEIINGINGLYNTTVSDDAMKMQKEFVNETAGKIEIDEDAVNDMRTRSVI